MQDTLPLAFVIAAALLLWPTAIILTIRSRRK